MSQSRDSQVTEQAKERDDYTCQKCGYVAIGVGLLVVGSTCVLAGLGQ